MNNEIDFIFEKLFSFYQVTGASELSEKIGATPQTISNWKKRNSVNAIKKKCRELKIYDDIFEKFVLQNANDLINRLMEFYGVETISELAKFVNVCHQSISRWRTNNSVNAIKKKCRELKIYDDIFKDFKVEENSIEDKELYKNFSNIKKSILYSFLEVYNKLEEKNELGKLHNMLGKLEFEDENYE